VTPAEFGDPAERAGPTIAVLLLLLAFFAWDRVVLAVSLPEIRDALGMAPSQAGLIATAFTAGLAAVAVPTGVMVRRFGFRPALVGGALLFSAATFYPPFAAGYADLLASRILVGVGEGVFHVSLLLYLARLSAKHRAALIGLAATVYGLAASVGPSAIHGFNDQMGTWHTGFYVLASAGIVLCLPLMLFVAPRSTQSDKEIGRRVEWTQMRRFWPLLALTGVQGLTVYSVSGLLPVWTRANFDFTAAQGALALGAFGFGAMMGGAPMGLIADRFSRNKYLLLVGVVSAISAVALMAFDGGLTYTIVLAFIFGTVANSLYVTSIALAQESAGPDSAVLVGLIVTTFYGVASASGFVLMWMSGMLGYQGAAFVTYATLYVIGLGAFYFFTRHPAT
jgi:MFS transporter, DHA1 family, inner membrane transport protein